MIKFNTDSESINASNMWNICDSKNIYPIIESKKHCFVKFRQRTNKNNIDANRLANTLNLSISNAETLLSKYQLKTDKHTFILYDKFNCFTVWIYGNC